MRFCQRLRSRTNDRNNSTRGHKRVRLALERLEDRLAPAVITYTWTGGGDGVSWHDGNNWTNGGPDSLGAGNTAVLVFNANTPTAMTDDLVNTHTFDEIEFSNAGGPASSGYSISGTNTIHLGSAAGIQVDNGAAVNSGVNAAFSETFGSGITIVQDVASQITNNDPHVNLVINGTVNLNGNLLSVTGTNSGAFETPNRGVVLNGQVTGAGGVSLNGELTLAGANDYTGNTTIGSAVGGSVVHVTNNSGLGSTANTVTLTANSGSVLLLDGVSVTQAGLNLNNATALYAQGPSGASGGTATWNGPITLAAGSEFIANIPKDTHLIINGSIGGGGGTLNVVVVHGPED
jgi:hypothetical protein